MKKSVFYILILAIGCTQDPEIIPDPIDASNINFGIEYFPSFEETVYPSVLIAWREHDIKVFSYTITNPNTTDMTVMLGIDSNAIMSETHQTEVIPPGTHTVYFSPNWNYQEMIYLDQPGTVNVQYTVTINSKVVTTGSQRGLLVSVSMAI
jgi:hypothetical protein